VLHFCTADDQVRRIVEPLVEAGQVYTRGGVDVIGRDADVFADLVFRGPTVRLSCVAKSLRFVSSIST
jgi:hypothetical protein